MKYIELEIILKTFILCSLLYSILYINIISNYNSTSLGPFALEIKICHITYYPEIISR